MRHHQMEPSFGPDIDTAGTLRATCAHALVDCPGLSDADLLTALLEPLTDHDKAVRIDAARAIANVGGITAALVLRLRVLLGPVSKLKDEPEALGAASAALLSLDPSAVPLIAKALEAEDDFAAEAAFALAELRTPDALAPSSRIFAPASIPPSRPRSSPPSHSLEATKPSPFSLTSSCATHGSSRRPRSIGPHRAAY